MYSQSGKIQGQRPGLHQTLEILRRLGRVHSPWRSLPVNYHASAFIFKGGLGPQAETPRLVYSKGVAKVLAFATDPAV